MNTKLEMKNNKNFIKVTSLHPHHPKISTVLGDTQGLDSELQNEFEQLVENRCSQRLAPLASTIRYKPCPSPYLPGAVVFLTNRDVSL